LGEERLYPFWVASNESATHVGNGLDKVVWLTFSVLMLKPTHTDVNIILIAGEMLAAAYQTLNAFRGTSLIILSHPFGCGRLQ
jgi:hypothetical protein